MRKSQNFMAEEQSCSFRSTAICYWLHVREGLKHIGKKWQTLYNIYNVFVELINYS